MRQLDYPFAEVVAQGSQMIEAGYTVHQKFTCESCGSRQTMATPNMFFQKGDCEECSFCSDLLANGCNFIVIFSTTNAGNTDAT